MEAIDGYVYVGKASSTWDDNTGRAWVYFTIMKYDMVNSGSAYYVGGDGFGNRGLGDIASNGTYIFYVNSAMEEAPDWTIGESDFYVWDTDTSYNFEAHWDSQGVIGIDVLTDDLVAVGFEHGFTVLDVSDLDDIGEVAYYEDLDSNMNFTHFALKDNRLYAMGHPRSGYARLYMFKLDDCVISGICELQKTPTDFRFYNFPNPFNSSCRFAFSGLNEPIKNIEIYDVNGRMVDTISPSAGGIYPAPTIRELRWQPKNLPSGIYLARVKIGDKLLIKRVVYLK